MGNNGPKPLLPILGVPLLARILFSLEEAGIRDAYVVLGYEGDRVRDAISRISRLSLRIHWLYNTRWEEGNGLSVLAAREALQAPFVLTMADHVFDPAIVRRLRSVGGPPTGIDLVVDYDLGRVPDLEDATRVLVDGGERIDRIGKLLPEFNAVDTGFFLAHPILFEALEEAAAEGKCSLSDGVQVLANRGLARARDIRGDQWLDVDTPAAAAEVERGLLAQLGKPTDGLVARVVNRPISKAVTRRLVSTRVTPNQVSLFNLGLGMVAGLAAAVGGYAAFLLAAALFQLTSILDGTDGELAKLKFQTSRQGEWIDTISDGLTYLVFLVGLSVGVARSDLPQFVQLSGMLGFIPALVAFGGLYAHLIRKGSSASLLTLEGDVDGREGGLQRVTELAWPLLKRDFFSVFFLILAIAGLLPLALPLFFVAACGLLAFSMWLNRRVISGAWRRREAAESPE